MSIAADNRTRSVRAFAERALQWWLTELHATWRALAPAGLGVRAEAVLEAGERYWLVRHRQQPIGQIDRALSDPDATERDLRRILGGRRQRSVAVEIPHERALAKRILLPAATARDLDRMLDFEVVRHFPFPPDRVYISHRVLSGGADARGSIEVELVAVPRETVAEILDALRRADVRARSVAVAGPGAAPIALPVAPARRPFGRGEAFLIASLAVLVAAALVSPLLHDRLRLAALERQTVALAPQVTAIRDAHERAQSAAGRMAGPLRLVASRPPLVAVLDGLSRAVPDGSWLQSLSLAGHELTIEGLSPSAAALALALEKSRLFAKVSFRAPITRDAATGLEHFQLAAAIADGKP